MSKDSLWNPMHQLFRDYCWNSYIIVAVLRDRCEMDLSTESHDREKDVFMVSVACFLPLTILLVIYVM